MTILTAQPDTAALARSYARGTLKILLLGVFTYGSTDSWKLLALRRMGHKVVPFAYRDTPVEELFPQGEPFDLVFVSKGVPLTRAQFAHLSGLGKHRLLWWPDPFENWNDDLTAALLSGAWSVSATSSAVLWKIREAVARATASNMVPTLLHDTRILEGCDCEGPRFDLMPERIRPALLHFGHLSDRRKKILDALRAGGVEVNHLETPLYGAQLQQEVLRHAAVLGINTSPDLYSNRVQTVLAMGGVILQENAPGLDTDFDVDDGLPPYSFLRFDWDRDEEDGVRTLFQDVLDSNLRDRQDAETIYQRFRWEAVLERAIDFAMGCSDVVR